MTISAESLVSKGLFPENLPSVFTSERIWPHLPLPATSYAVTSKAIGELCTYDASKRGGQRRIFGIPHPLFIRDQGIFFERHWPVLEACFEAAKGSTSRPITDDAGPRHVRITRHSELPKIRLIRLSRFAFCLVADVSRCYYSIYSHSIPWALHGKTAAKDDTNAQSATVFGNRLDYTVRQAQSRQTMGIPVGPDSSTIIAELVMSAVDKRMIELSGSKPPTYVRHVDDYWIGGRTYDECERYLTNLRLALNDFSLDVNELKTRIISTKFVFGETWPSQSSVKFQHISLSR
jgi:Reverse transcriptase (RNA-dependent DNA polymerase)